MSYRTTLTAIAFAALATLVPALGQAQDFEAVEGVYRLSEINHARVPVVVDVDDEGRCRKEVVSGSLTLYRSGRWSLVSNDRKVCYDDFVADVDRHGGEGGFLLDGRTVTFFDEHGNFPDWDQGDHEIKVEDPMIGTLERDAISVQLDDGAVAVFRR